MSGSLTDDLNKIGIPGAGTAIGNGKEAGVSKVIDLSRLNREKTLEIGDRNSIIEDRRLSDISNRDKKNGDSLMGEYTNRSRDLRFSRRTGSLKYGSVENSLRRKCSLLRGESKDPKFNKSTLGLKEDLKEGRGSGAGRMSNQY